MRPTTTPTNDRDTLEPLPNVLARVSLAKPTIYKLIAKGEFPRPIKIGRASRWRASDIDAWIAAQQTNGGAQ